MTSVGRDLVEEELKMEVRVKESEVRYMILIVSMKSSAGNSQVSVGSRSSEWIWTNRHPRKRRVRISMRSNIGKGDEERKERK